jgi:hypothetical protein
MNTTMGSILKSICKRSSIASIPRQEQVAGQIDAHTSIISISLQPLLFPPTGLQADSRPFRSSARITSTYSSTGLFKAGRTSMEAIRSATIVPARAMNLDQGAERTKPKGHAQQSASARRLGSVGRWIPCQDHGLRYRSTAECWGLRCMSLLLLLLASG